MVFMLVLLGKRIVIHFFQKALKHLQSGKLLALLFSEEKSKDETKTEGASSTATTAVILIAIAIATQHAETAITGAFQSTTSIYPTLELGEVSCTTDSYNNWVISITIKNPRDFGNGIFNIWVNDTLTMRDSDPPTEAVATITTDLRGNWTTIPGGGEETFTVWIGAINERSNFTFSSGSIVDVRFQSTTGDYYSVLLELYSGTGFIEQSGFRIPIARKNTSIFDGSLWVVLPVIGIFM
jgi:hypothetical protein